MFYQTISGLNLYYDQEEQESVKSIATACERSIQMLQQRWGLPIPTHLRVYVMTSWARFLFLSAPWPWKLLITLTFPLIARRARSMWPYSGGWFLSYGKQRVIGIKPHRLIHSADLSLGKQLFQQNRTVDEIVQSVTCHELTHALTFHLRLPIWLYEGVATLAMEFFLERRIVRPETLDSLSLLPVEKMRMERLQAGNPQVMLAQFARAYWVTRYIEESQPELLKRVFAEQPGQTLLEETVAAAFGKNLASIWPEVIDEIKAWYEKYPCGSFH